MKGALAARCETRLSSQDFYDGFLSRAAALFILCAKTVASLRR
jgi:hypothetical protein